MTTRVWFETHSSTTDNANRIATGWLPGELSALGRDQARSLGDRILVRRPAAIFVSDLDRATQTVRLALDHADATIPVIIDHRLRECDYGSLNGAPHDQVHGDRLRYLTDPYPDGESWQTAIDRAVAAVREAVDRHPEQTIMIIGHVATRLAVQQVATGSPVADLVSAEVGWQPGWSYQLTGSEG
jgi:2,3-bisphosphoglycerate-dependent phosphoglycerate mutase